MKDNALDDIHVHSPTSSSWFLIIINLGDFGIKNKAIHCIKAKIPEIPNIILL